jgi:hypothetical protein
MNDGWYASRCRSRRPARLELPVGRDVGALLRGVDPGAPVVPAGFAPALPDGVDPPALAPDPLGGGAPAGRAEEG